MLAKLRQGLEYHGSLEIMIELLCQDYPDEHRHPKPESAGSTMTPLEARERANDGGIQ